MPESSGGSSQTIEFGSLRAMLKSQFRAALVMLEQAVERCPEELWMDKNHPNEFWHVAYHALFFVHMYFQPSREVFQPWEKHREEYQFLGSIPFPPHRPPNIGEPYTKAEILEFCRVCVTAIDASIDHMDLGASECGFWWYKMSKLEHQFVSLRHIQHHAAQLMDRLRNHAGIGVDWVGSRA